MSLRLPPVSCESEELPTVYRSALFSRCWVAAGTAIAGLPLAYVIAFLVRHPPAVGEVGPLFLALFFLLLPLVFWLLRFGHYFRRFEVEERRLVVTTLWYRWEVPWRDVTRIIRRTRVKPFGERTYRVRLKVEAYDGNADWIDLFDSALPAADALYDQVQRHVPFVRPREIEDQVPLRRFL